MPCQAAVNDKRKRAARADGVLWAVKGKRKPRRCLSSSQKKRTKKHESVRAKVPSRACQSIRCRAAEHVFRAIKCQLAYRKARYRGLAKNEAQMFSLMALANIYMVRRQLREGSV